ncbi:hypothetical protein CS063_00390 [Sporanaerobium hydrogeniformans]|uniref:Uncharacterized protein n=1 Tax=Sporanaerobium hydrogeniformans TaxID=3072179 RepID=A0AC61DGK6_9FIRM|nr:DUF421 domain-containing protein [Sporanaerobium hydrogeniformans]PHV71968.1 hypothetical protein CS063_00390 [Sporanaerobium hydrogeniformans]
MEILEAILTALVSIVTLFILSKLMGNREMSQLSMFDYINGITIGSIAAELATSMFTDVLKPLTAMIIYGLITTLLSICTNKSIKLRRFITGRPILLYDKGELYYKNMAKAKMDLNEFLTQCRVNGQFDLHTLQTVILEPNGKLSFLPRSDQRPLTPHDLKFKPSQDYLVANLIIDGHIMLENLHYMGLDEVWLQKQLQSQDAPPLSDIFLATCDRDHNVHIYKKIETEMKKDIFI